MRPKSVKAARGTDISCKGWHQEAALRMLNNNLDAEVAENPDECPATHPLLLKTLPVQCAG